MRVLFGWELGDNLGHLASFAPVARGLSERGAEVHLVVKQLNGVDRFFPDHPPVHSAPRWKPEGHQGPPQDYAEVLQRFGYREEASLGLLMRAWDSLLCSIDPDVVVTDAAPTLLLAARGRCPCMQLGTGYAQPPNVRPLPPMRWWEPRSERHGRAESEVLEVIGRVTDPLPDLGALFVTEHAFIKGARQVDPYGPLRGHARYFDFPGERHTERLPWPTGAGKRIFVYLQRGYPGLRAVLEAVERRGHRAIVYVPGADPRVRRAHPGLVFLDGPAALASVTQQADAAICHSISGTGWRFLQAGTPVMILPAHQEQEMAARTAREAGVVVHGELGPASWHSCLDALFDPGLPHRVRSWVAQNRAEQCTPDQVVQALLESG